MNHGTKARFTMVAALLLASGCGTRVVNGGADLTGTGGGVGGDVCMVAADCGNPDCEGKPVNCGEPAAPTCISATTLRGPTAAGICAAGACSQGHVETEYPAGCSTAPRSQMLAVGDQHACAIAPGGELKCWGIGGWGALGEKGVTLAPVPVTVTGLSSGVVAVSAGGFNTCAITEGGAVQCWGVKKGEPATPGADWVPVSVPGLSSGSVAVTVGNVNCAVTSAGALECWTRGWDGILGNGSKTGSSVPVPVASLSSGVVAVASAGNVCALTVSGGVKCWGMGAYGQLGTGTTVDSLVPVDVLGLSSGVVALASSDLHTCALTAASAVKCWGVQLEKADGTGATTQSLAPVDVAGLPSGIVAIAAGDAHTCALTAIGAVVCWGYNDRGQLGNGTTDASWTPVPVTGLSSGVVAIAAGGRHTCARLASGAITCWGADADWPVGGEHADSPVPIAVVGF